MNMQFTNNHEHFSDQGEPDFIKKSFCPAWDNKPEIFPPVVTLAGTSILTAQNATCIVAPQGTGKSACLEAVAASLLNPTADCLGFQVAPDCPSILSFDCERTPGDVWNSFSRMCRRAGVREGTPVEKVKIVGLRACRDVATRKKTIEYFLQKHRPGLLIIDGAGDLVDDTNDNVQAVQFKEWLREITEKYNACVLVSLHPNPASEKARGHIGSELMRECENVLIIKKSGPIREITTEFLHGKTRNTGDVSAGFAWSEQYGMFLSADLETTARERMAAKEETKRSDLEELARRCLKPPSALSYKALTIAIEENAGVEERTAKRRIAVMLKLQIVEKRTDDRYQLNIRSG
jgi:hypothetical protein